MAFDNMNDASERWLTGNTVVEGRPLFLRRLEKIDLEHIRKFLPILFVVVQKLAKVQANGLPEGEYNFSLADFDTYLLALIRDGGKGGVVLVETFGGQRIYYSYIARERSTKQLVDNLTARYPEYSLKTLERDDPEAEFIQKYLAKLQ